MLRVYPDTSIWLDYFEKRGDNGWAAIRMLKGLVRNNAIIGYSDVILLELKHLGYSKQEIYSILKILTPKNSRRIHIGKGQIEEAKRMAKARNIPKKDALHAILCRDDDFEFVTRDRHFRAISDVVSVKIPEDFI
jgi:predicted nucleic acid-binding protein